MSEIDPPSEEAPGRRERLLREASRIFAAKGFNKSSTREIALAAGANISLIAYYFGDKQGLYREVLLRPILDVLAAVPPIDPEQPLPDWLRGFYAALLRPMLMDDSELAHLMRLLGREMVEPSPGFEELCARHIAPLHQSLIGFLAQRCGVPAQQAAADMGLQHLAHALTAIAHDYWMSMDYMEALAPGVARGPGAYQRVLERMVGYGLALIACERELRQAPAAEGNKKGKERKA